jgi:hypothetical protein
MKHLKAGLGSRKSNRIYALPLFLVLALLTMSGNAQQVTTSSKPSGSISDTAAIIEKIPQFFQVVTGIGTLLVLYQSLVLTRRLKKADVLMECGRRFDQLVDRRESICNGSQKDSCYYYERFWNLQNDEFSLWREGYIDDKTYEGWLEARHEESLKNEMVADRSYKDGWIHFRGKTKDRVFLEFMEYVFDGKIDRAMNQYKKIRMRF